MSLLYGDFGGRLVVEVKDRYLRPREPREWNLIPLALRATKENFEAILEPGHFITISHVPNKVLSTIQSQKPPLRDVLPFLPVAKLLSSTDRVFSARTTSLGQSGVMAQAT